MKDRPSYSRRIRQLWAVLLKKVWDIDALKCPKCGGEMKVISFIEQPFVIRHIQKHLDLLEYPRPPSQLLESSSPREPPPQALSEPDVKVSLHPALIVQPYA